jgi:hypothetical protein
MHRILRFLKSLLFHIGAGFPKSTQKQIIDRYNICKLCEKFENNQCLECGCNLSTKSIFLNKLAWADQECPIGKWSKVNC